MTWEERTKDCKDFFDVKGPLGVPLYAYGLLIAACILLIIARLVG